MAVRLLRPLAALACAGLIAAHGQPARQISAGKSATALVVLPSLDGFGSAFCIDRSGYFVTCAHVVDGMKEGKTLQLVLNAGEDNENVTVAKVIRFDNEVDLAVLKAPASDKYVALPLGDDQHLSETSPVTAFGFPFGGMLAVSKQNYPNISVNTGRITSIRKSKGKLEAIQVDAQLNPGNSGGPVLNASGKVIGVVASGVPGAGVNFLVPVSHLDKLLAPVIDLSPAELPFEKRQETTDFSLRITEFSRSTKFSQIELVLGIGEAERRFTAKPLSDGTYRVSAVVLPATPAGSGSSHDSSSVPYRVIAKTVPGSTVEHQGEILLKNAPPGVDLPPVGTLAKFSFNGQPVLPKFLKPSSELKGSPEGFYFEKRKLLLSKSADFLASNFRMDVVVHVSDDDHGAGGITFLGLGSGDTGAYDEPTDWVGLRLHRPQLGEGGIFIAKFPADDDVRLGRIGNAGTHLLRMEKQGNSITFSVVQDYDGATFKPTFSKTIDDIRKFQPKLQDNKVRLIVGGAGTFSGLVFEQR